MSKKRVVVSLGHDALGYTTTEQWDAVKVTAKALADLVEADYQLTITHSNGPQVSMIIPPVARGWGGGVKLGDGIRLGQGCLWFHPLYFPPLCVSAPLWAGGWGGLGDSPLFVGGCGFPSRSAPSSPRCNRRPL